MVLIIWHVVSSVILPENAAFSLSHSGSIDGLVVDWVVVETPVVDGLIVDGLVAFQPADERDVEHVVNETSVGSWSVLREVVNLCSVGSWSVPREIVNRCSVGSWSILKEAVN